MATLRFVLKRLVAQRLLALAMIVTLAFSVGVLVAGPIYADSARAAILSSELSSANVAQRNLRITAFGTTGFDFGRATRDLRRAVNGVPVAKIIPQGLSAVRLASGRYQADVTLLFREGAGSHLGLQGRPPTGPGDVVLSSGTARGLRVHTGDTITATAGNTSVRLSV